jgi:nucleoside-diphosphate-sugar epimerase
VTTVLVTGASGFIGRQVLGPLLSRGYEVHALSSRPVTGRSNDVEWHQVDLADSQRLRAVVAAVKPARLLHLAWSMSSSGSAYAGEQYRSVSATLDLIRLFIEHGGERAVVAGSCAEYDWRYGLCSESTTPLTPASLYGICKNAARSVCEGYAHAEGVSLAWGRVFFVYGPHQPLPRLVPSIVSALLKGEVGRCKHGGYIRDYLHVADVGAAFATLLDADSVRGAINIASGRPVTLRAIAEQIASHLGATDRLRVDDDASAGEPPVVMADIHRLAQATPCRPAFDLHRGLADTIAFYEQQLHSSVAAL